MPSVSSATSGTSVVNSATGSSGTSIAENFDQFLTLLTTQLKNQNPLDPLDTNQFTQQLVQFAGVEQQIKTNDRLTSILAMNSATAVTGAMGLVGAKITADGSSSTLQNGAANWTLNAPSSGKATITIKDSNGSVVHTEERTLSSGTQTYTWNGRNALGTKLPDGQYSIVIDGQDATGARMSVKTEITGVVDTVDLSTGDILLKIGNQSIPASKVKTISHSN